MANVWQAYGSGALPTGAAERTGMDWSDDGIVLVTRRHGESALILDALTRAYGRHAGVVRGGQSRRMTPLLQPGNLLELTWRARLAEHLGTYTAELMRDRAAGLMENRGTLAGLGAVTGLLAYALPERLAMPDLYDRTTQLLDVMTVTPAWTLMYLHWELALLEDLGFGLDLAACAVTGAEEDLAYVSPRTGRAVSRAAGAEWADRLLPLPPCLRGEGAAEDTEIAEALGTTGHFLHKHLSGQWEGQSFPAARARLVDWIGRSKAAGLR